MSLNPSRSQWKPTGLVPSPTLEFPETVEEGSCSELPCTIIDLANREATDGGCKRPEELSASKVLLGVIWA